MPRVRRVASALLLLVALELRAGTLAHPSGATVIAPVADLFTRPDETSPVEDQVLLGERVEILEETAGFARVRARDGEIAWMPERALRRGPADAPRRWAEVTSARAHVYGEPSFTARRPLLSAPLGARLAAEEEFSSDGHDWVRVTLPDGRGAFVARADVAVRAPGEGPPAGTPSDWIALGTRFLGAPYTWGGTTPDGFDCSGLVYRILERHGVLVKRNSSAQCFREPRLRPVSFADLRPGDLLFFGTDEKIDHEALWLGDGKVLQASAYGVPSTQITPFEESPRLKERFRYARRLDGPLPRVDAAALEARLKALASGGEASYGVVFKDLGSGATVRLGADRVYHAASTMKTPVMLEVLRRVDAGTLKLTDEIPVVNEFRSALDGSAFKVEIEHESDDPTVAKLGGKATLGFLVKEMIVRSSNFATNLVLTHLGAGSVQAFLDRIGAGTVKVRRGVDDLKSFEAGLNNETDAAGMAAVMEAAVRSPKLSPDARKIAWEILAGQVFNDQIPSGLHPQSGAIVAHKTGNISSVQHDAAVVRLPDGREYVLVLLAGDFGANEEGRKKVVETTRRMSRAAWEAMIAP